MKLKTSVLKFKSGRKPKPKVVFTDLSEFYLIQLKPSATCLKLECDENVHITYRIPTTNKIEIVQRDGGTFFYKISWTIANIHYDLYTNNVFLVFDLLKWAPCTEISVPSSGQVSTNFCETVAHVCMFVHAGISVRDWMRWINACCR